MVGLQKLLYLRTPSLEKKGRPKVLFLPINSGKEVAIIKVKQALKK